MTAADIAIRTRAGESCVPEVMGSLAQIATDRYNAFVSADPAAAERAVAIDAVVARGGDPGSLAGVPVALKDLIDHRGRVTTAGSSFLRLHPGRSATVVNRLEEAGAVIVGRTGLHEFALGFSSENDWFGPIRNPWDPAASPGGSSGGSAAAVAAGMVPVAIGTDTGGSVRVPAALCGCVGLKVTHGRVSLAGVFPVAPSRDTVGPIATTVTDAAAVYLAIAGDDPQDPWSRPMPVQSPGAPAALSGLRIGVPHPWVDRPLAPEVAAGWRSFLAGLSRAGAEMVDLAAPVLDPAAMPRAVYAEVAAVHRGWMTTHPDRYGPALRDRLLTDMGHTADDTARAWEWRQRLVAAFERLFGTVAVLVTPTTPALRKVIGEDLIAAGADPEPHRPALSWFTNLVNQAGLPALALPLAGGDGAGPPVSVQLIGPQWTEHRLLEIGLALEGVGISAFSRPGR